jgi:hypothetical protein
MLNFLLVILSFIKKKYGSKIGVGGGSEKQNPSLSRTFGRKLLVTLLISYLNKIMLKIQTCSMCHNIAMVLSTNVP